MFYPEAPLQEVRRVQLAIGHGRHRDCWKARWFWWRCARGQALGKSRSKNLIRGNGRVDCAVGRPRRDGCAAHAAQHSSLKRLVVGRIRADQVGHSSRQDVTENSEAGSEHGFWLELPRNRRSRLQKGRRCGREQMAEMSLNNGVQRLIIMRNGTEGAAK